MTTFNQMLQLMPLTLTQRFLISAWSGRLGGGGGIRRVESVGGLNSFEESIL